MDLTILNVALNTIQRDLNASNAGIQWMLDSYMVTFAAFLYTGGVCADRFGRKKSLIAGLLLFGAASVLAAYSHSITELIVWRCIQGVGAAAALPTTMAVIVNVFPPAERPKAIGVWASTAGLAMAVGPMVGGLLLQAFSWGSVFLINAPLVVIGVVLIARMVPESRNPKPSRFDPLGMLMPVLGVGGLVYGIITGGEHDNWLAPGTLGPILGGVVLIGLLLALESRRDANNAFDVKLFGKARFSAGIFTIAMCFLVMIGALFVVSYYFQAVHGYTPLAAGLMMLPMGVGLVFSSSRCAKLAARYGARLVVAFGATTMALAFVLYSFVGAGTPLWELVIIQLVFGIGWGCIMAPATASLMSVVPPAKAGAGQAVAQTVRQIAGALGVAIVGSVLAVVYRSNLGSAVDVLPAGVRDEAAGSVGGTQEAINATPQLPKPDVATLVARSHDAYLSGMSVTMVIATIVSLAAALVALRWLPGRPVAPPAVPTTQQAARTS